MLSVDITRHAVVHSTGGADLVLSLLLLNSYTKFSMWGGGVECARQGGAPP